MHIVLGILKIIGIILLVILGLVLLILGLVLFVPFRYQAGVVRSQGFPDGEASVTWLLRAVRLTVAFKDKKLKGALKVLCFTLKRFGSWDEADKKPSNEGGSTKEQPADETQAQAAETQGQAAISTAEDQTVLTSAEREDHKLQPEQLKAESDQLKEKQKEEKKQKKALKKQEKKPEKLSVKEKINRLINKNMERIAAAPQKAMDLLLMIIDAIDGKAQAAEALAEKLVKKAESAEKKAAPFLEAESINYFKWLLRRLGGLLHHFRIRRIKGFLKFGTGAPDMTGFLTGLLYRILPAGAAGYEVDPYFDQTVFETDTILKGHIRACHILWLVILAALRKDTWHMLRKLRRKDKGGK